MSGARLVGARVEPRRPLRGRAAWLRQPATFTAHLVGHDERTGRKWSGGETPIPGSIATLLRLALALKLSADRIRELLRV